MKATARWPRVARENAITALRCAVASWFALWWLNAGIGGRHNVPDNLPVGFLAVSIIVLSRDANSLGAWLLLGARRRGVARGQRGLRVEGVRPEHLGRLSSLLSS